jgi:predicted TIM-barrel fold metal-dependent hydrolase
LCCPKKKFRTKQKTITPPFKLNGRSLAHVIQHKINIGYAAAIKQAPRRIPLAQRKEVEDEIDKMLDNNVIIQSVSMGKPNSCGQKERQLCSSLHRLSKVKPSYDERFIPFASH